MFIAYNPKDYLGGSQTQNTIIVPRDMTIISPLKIIRVVSIFTQVCCNISDDILAQDIHSMHCLSRYEIEKIHKYKYNSLSGLYCKKRKSTNTTVLSHLYCKKEKYKYNIAEASTLSVTKVESLILPFASKGNESMAMHWH